PRPARRRTAQAQEGAVQPALPARHRAARQHGAGARGAPRDRPDQDGRAGQARGPAGHLRSGQMPKRVLQAEVVSSKQAQTEGVRVERRFTHPVMKKAVRSSKKYYAHAEKGEYGVGDRGWIEEHRPISKLKRWTVVQGQKKASVSA